MTAPRATIEVRMDSAFFSDAIVSRLESEGVEFTISVPFERFAKLKYIVEGRKRWCHLDQRCNFFDMQWKPDSWQQKQRFIFIRTCSRKQHKGPLQLDMFIPYEYGYDFKVIFANKGLSAKKALAFHNGRGSQEGIFAELKSHAQMDYIPTRRQAGNQIYMLAAILAHNLSREMQMMANKR